MSAPARFRRRSISNPGKRLDVASDRADRSGRFASVGVRVIAAIVAAHRITLFKCETMWINELKFFGFLASDQGAKLIID